MLLHHLEFVRISAKIHQHHYLCTGSLEQIQLRRKVVTEMKKLPVCFQSFSENAEKGRMVHLEREYQIYHVSVNMFLAIYLDVKFVVMLKEIVHESLSCFLL